MSQSTARDSDRVKSSPIDLSGVFLRRTNLSGANLSWANLSRADFSNADFRGANFEGANIDGTILHGADLTDVRNLTAEQLARARIDDRTKLPHDLQPPASTT